MFAKRDEDTERNGGATKKEGAVAYNCFFFL